MTLKTYSLGYNHGYEDAFAGILSKDAGKIDDTRYARGYAQGYSDGAYRRQQRLAERRKWSVQR